MYSKTPQAALAAQQSALRMAAEMFIKFADQQIDTINIENATWEDVSRFAMEVEVARIAIDSITESE
jgi:hypothetical protein